MNVIYVEPSGRAYTIEQLHETALTINTALSIWEKIKKAMVVLAEAVKPIWERIHEAFGNDLTLFEEITIRREELKQRGGNWYWVTLEHLEQSKRHMKRSKPYINKRIYRRQTR